VRVTYTTLECAERFVVLRFRGAGSIARVSDWLLNRNRGGDGGAGIRRITVGQDNTVIGFFSKDKKVGEIKKFARHLLDVYAGRM